MLASLCLIAGALVPGQSLGGSGWLLTPRFNAAQELVYRGTVSEESVTKGVQFTRVYQLETRMLVLEASPRAAQVAFFTVLKVRGGSSAEPASKTGPGSVRLELARVDSQGRVAAEAGTSLLPPLDGPGTIECGAVVEVPNRHVGVGGAWETAEEGRPPLAWTVVGAEPVLGVPCVKLEGVQQSEDWERPRADRTAWRRRELVWLSPRTGIASRVERTLEQRDPARRDTTERTLTRYELESSLAYPAALNEDRQRDIRRAREFAASAEPLVSAPGKFAPRHFETLAATIDRYLDQHPPTPYREAVVQVKRRLEAARKGQSPPVRLTSSGPPAVAAHGQPAPDFILPCLTGPGSVRLHRLRDRPLLLVFYSPTSSNAEPVLRFAQNVLETNQGQVLGLAVSEDTSAIVRQHAGLQLGFPIVSGKGLRLTYAVEATPKFIVLDADGIVRGAYVGWGAEIPALVSNDLKSREPRVESREPERSREPRVESREPERSREPRVESREPEPNKSREPSRSRKQDP